MTTQTKEPKMAKKQKPTMEGSKKEEMMDKKAGVKPAKGKGKGKGC